MFAPNLQLEGSSVEHKMIEDAKSEGQVFGSEAPIDWYVRKGKTFAPAPYSWPLRLNPLPGCLQGHAPPRIISSQLMPQEPQHPPIWDKVSPKTRGYLAQAQRHRIEQEQEGKGSKMSAAEQT